MLPCFASNIQIGIQTRTSQCTKRIQFPFFLSISTWSLTSPLYCVSTYKDASAQAPPSTPSFALILPAFSCIVSVHLSAAPAAAPVSWVRKKLISPCRKATSVSGGTHGSFFKHSLLLDTVVAEAAQRLVIPYCWVRHWCCWKISCFSLELPRLALAGWHLNHFLN